jgi:hypothetical protein
VMEDGVVSHPVAGTPQGGVISPLLSNIYLHVLDRVWARHGQHLGELVRYADDCVPRRRAEGAIRPRGQAAREMRAGPSKPAYRRRLQTTHCCCAQEAWW